MPTKKYQWFKVAAFETDLAFAANNIAVALVNQKNICIGRHQQQLFAFAHKCPHAGGLMAQGFIDVLGQVVCPLHRYKFSLQNGRNTSGEGYYLKHWPVEKRQDGIYVGMEEPHFLGLF
jgi:nitrite reductase/ring-hydroxylating ferredoxin subunit